MRSGKLFAKAACVACIAALLVAGVVTVSGCSTANRIINAVSSHMNLGTAGRAQVESATASEVFTGGEVREPQVQLKGNGEDKVTILVYMNGSNLETDSGEATTDLSEMVAAGSSDNVTIALQTMGTKKWQKYGIASDRSQRYTVDGSGLHLVNDNLGQLDTTSQDTLTDFLNWGTATYPADRYMLVMWDHGGGPVYGFGYDEWQSEDSTLTLDEIQGALRSSNTYFDMIGMDCCIMSSIEVSCALYEYCDYTLLSEDFESYLGWNYTDWLKALYANTSITTPEMAATLIDATIKADSSNNADGIHALIDEGMMKVLYTAWTDFAYKNEDTLLNANYSQNVSRVKRGREHPLLEKLQAQNRPFSFGGGDYMQGYEFQSTYSLSDYFVTDIMSVAQNITSDESSALSSALSEAIVYTNCTDGDKGMTGLSVTLPYSDSSFYGKLKTILTNCGFDSTYIEWLSKFADVKSSTDSYDFSSWIDQWQGWGDYVNNYDWSDWGYYGLDDYWGSSDSSTYGGGDGQYGSDDSQGYGWGGWDYGGYYGYGPQSGASYYDYGRY